MHAFPNSDLILSEVKIRNFRSIKEVNIKLSRASILIGENNSGKTSFIEALNAALGKGTKKFLPEDIFLAYGEVSPPKDRHIIVDICIRPYNNDKKEITDEFSKDWVHHWGNNIQFDDNDKEFVGIRVDYHWDDFEKEYEYERSSLKNWKDYTNFEEIETQNQLSYSKIEPISLYLLDAKRDIQDEFKQKSSFWNKLLLDINLDDSLIKEIEDSIQQLNGKIVDKSEVLSHIQGHLASLENTINLEKDSISINPLTRHVRDLYKGADVTFSTKDAQSFPISNYGMGTRSLATILTFKAYCQWQENKSPKPIHMTIALEEPEVHLHPQAQRALISQMKQISAQKIISTHSPYIASEINIEDFIFFSKKGDETNVSQIQPNDFTPIEIKKINQRIMKSNGELLYSRVLILFEGQTESEAIPIYAEKYWGKKPESHGITMVYVGGDNYTPFINLAKKANIPWYILADGENIPLTKLSRALGSIGEDTDLNNYTNIIYYPDGKNYDQYIVCPEYIDAIKSAIVSVNKMNDTHEESLKKKWQNKSDTEVLNELKYNKTKYALPVANAIVNLPDAKKRIPKKIMDLFDVISSEFKLEGYNEN